MITNGFHLREYRRFPVHCAFYYSNDEVQGAGTVWNLSVSGWRVDGTREVKTGMVFTLLVMLPEYHKTIIIERAIVRSTNRRNSSHGYRSSQAVRQLAHVIAAGPTVRRLVSPNHIPRLITPRICHQQGETNLTYEYVPSHPCWPPCDYHLSVASTGNNG